MSTRSLFLVALVSSTMLAALAGCGKSASDAVVGVATGGKVQVSQSGDQQQVTVKTDQGELHATTGGNVPLPKEFPGDVHLPASYTIKNAVTAGPAVVLDMHAPAALQAVYDDYRSAMKTGGWTEAMAMQSSQSEASLSFTKDKRSVVVAIIAASEGGGVDVHLQSTSGQ